MGENCVAQHGVRQAAQHRRLSPGMPGLRHHEAILPPPSPPEPPSPLWRPRMPTWSPAGRDSDPTPRRPPRNPDITRRRPTRAAVSAPLGHEERRRLRPPGARPDGTPTSPSGAPSRPAPRHSRAKGSRRPASPTCEPLCMELRSHPEPSAMEPRHHEQPTLTVPSKPPR